jgi:hypothetical protein
MIMMRYIMPSLASILIAAFLCGGCAPASPHDKPVKEALEALLQTDEFTQEERDAVGSIKVHNDMCWVWFKKNFTEEGETITTFSQHIAKQFANEFFEVAMDNGYRAPRYQVQVWMKITDDKGTHEARLCDAYYDLQKARLYFEAYGLGKYVGIK